MILGERELAWQIRVVNAATARGWIVYANTARNQRPASPNLVLLRGSRVLAVYLRTRAPRRDRRPPVEQLAAATGLPVVIWTPDEWRDILTGLDTDPPTNPVSGRSSTVTRA